MLPVSPARRAFLAASAAFALAPAAARAQSALPIRIGTDPTDTYAEPYYAEEMGFFKQAGLDAQVLDLQNGAAVAGGSVDVGVSTVVQLAQAVAHGLPFVLVAGGALYSSREPTTVLCVAKASPIANAKDLEGKTVAISALKTSSEIGVTAWVAENGADLSRVKLVEMPFAAMGPALARGAIDAALISEPALTRAKGADGVRVLAHSFDAVAPSFMLSVWFTTRAYAAQNAATLRRFIAATYASGAWANAHHAETAAILARVAKLDLDTVRTMARSTMSDGLALRDLQPQLDVAYKYGVLPVRVDASAMLLT